MKTKNIVIVILISVSLGAGIFFMTNKKTPTSPIISGVTKVTTPSPSLKPDLPAIDDKSDLKEEVKKLDPEDFTNDYKALRGETSNF